MSNEAIVHVVDDDAAVRQSIAFLLASDGLPVLVHDSALAFFEKVKHPVTGCIVTDVRMPGLDGVAFLKRLKAAAVPLPVIVMTGHADVALAVEAMKEGAVDFLEKPFDDEAFLAAVRLALSRGSGEALKTAQAGDARTRIATLSDREKQVFEGLVAGQSNKAIAIDLDISPRTVEIYRANVMTKMKAGSLSELVRMAVLSGA